MVRNLKVKKSKSIPLVIYLIDWLPKWWYVSDGCVIIPNPAKQVLKLYFLLMV